MDRINSSLRAALDSYNEGDLDAAIDYAQDAIDDLALLLDTKNDKE